MNYAWSDIVMKVKFLSTKLITAKMKDLITATRTFFVEELSLEFQNKMSIEQWNNGESEAAETQSEPQRLELKLNFTSD